MEINEFVKKYNLSQKEGVDMWKHKQSGKWILTHDACTKIATIENIHTLKIECLHSVEASVRLLITMTKYGVNDKPSKTETTIGEADGKNCRGNLYYGCMAEKRGKDRAILKLINAYEHGVASEVEADSYEEGKAEKKQPEAIPETTPYTPVKVSSSEKGGEGGLVKFGKHKDKSWSVIPDSYLDWCVENIENEDRLSEVRAEMKRRKV